MSLFPKKYDIKYSMEQLIELFRRLLRLTDTSYVRYLHDQIDWSACMLGIVDSRGVGKTTMLLQHIKLHHSMDDTLFVNADDIYFAEHRLFDLVSDFLFYLDNTNLAYALSDNSPEIGNIRGTFFFSQMKVNNEVFSSDKSNRQVHFRNRRKEQTTEADTGNR